MVPENDTKNSKDLSTPLQIGHITCRNRVFLAPMSGVSDVVFRKLAWKFGAGLVFSEMVASEALVNGQKLMALKAQGDTLPVHAVQIAGREAKWMGLAARMAQDNGAHLIDINMGCPARRVTHGLSGSALMRDLDHAMGLIEAVVEAVDVPVTLKMRLGWDEANMNAPELARRAQDAGIAMISVHGRTRCQFFKGSADWRAIAKVRAATHLPLVVNGDIVDATSARQALRQSGADAIMVGRASYGAPWKAGRIAGEIAGAIAQTQSGTSGPPGNICDIVQEHFDAVLSRFGSQKGIRIFRKHLGWYLETSSSIETGSTLRREMISGDDPGQIRRLISEAFSQSLLDDAA